MRAYLASLVLLIGCGGSTDNGTAAGGSATGGRSYVPFPGSSGDLGAGGTYQVLTGVNTSNGGVGNTGGANLAGGTISATSSISVGGDSAVIGGSSSGVGGAATGRI